mmetsp:Transcript_143398/g.458395  ORF Transcript_143398/g.458395 Transcript_143398/m.458395 type:complete len:865 (+) Transcript_143398:131-2725(+)
MAFFGCCRRGDTRSAQLSNVEVMADGKLGIAPKQSAVPTGQGAKGTLLTDASSKTVLGGLGRTFNSGMYGSDRGFSPAFVALGTWVIAWVYILISVIVAMRCYSHVGSSGQIGRDAMAIVRQIAGSGTFRGWATEEDEKAVHILKSEISGFELDFPDRIETMHQRTPISRNNIFGPFGEEACTNITLEECAKSWGTWERFESTSCAKTCPFDLKQPEGPRCCGLTSQQSVSAVGGAIVTSGPPLLPPFWSEVLWAHAEGDMSKDDAQNAGQRVKGMGSEEVMFSNIVFRVKGSGEGGNGSAIILSAHYDSVESVAFPFRRDQDHSLPTDRSPGVSDDLAGVGVLLEVARKLAAEEPLPRDVIFIFVSGEEAGLMGSAIFKQFHPWRHRPAFAINLEGKGKANSKEWLVRSNSGYATNAYAKFAPSPAGFSFGEWVFNNFNIGYTDLSVYRRLGYHGLDLAYVHDSYVYHTPDDNVDTASAEGLQHEGSNLLSIIRGVAQDPNFPAPLTPEEDPTVGLWNNEIDTDPGMNSHSVYVGMFDSWMWIMSETMTKVIFGLVVTLSVPVSGSLVWFLFSTTALRTSARRLVTGTAVDFGATLLALLLGIVAALVSVSVVGLRDLRTWYDWQLLRLIFVALAGALPMLAIELLRRGRGPALLRAGDQQTDHSAVLGAHGVQAVLLLVCAKYLPHLGFCLFWNVLFLPLGLAADVCLTVFVLPNVPSRLRRRPEALELLEASGGETEGETLRLPFVAGKDEQRDQLFVAISARELLGLFVPLVLTLPQIYNLLFVFTYMIDEMPANLVVGGLIGISGAVLALPFLPATRRLGADHLGGVMLVFALLWIVLAVTCLLVPTDTEHYCYFGLTC